MTELYLEVSFFIGLVIVVDGLLLVKNEGAMVPGSMNSVTTAIEFLWAIVTVVTLFKLSFSELQIIVPALYLAHNMAGWGYGFWLEYKDPIDDKSIIYVPLWYAKYGMHFGVIFTVLCGFVVFKSYS